MDTLTKLPPKHLARAAFVVIAATLTVSGLTPAMAANKAHEHGVGRMNVAVEAQNVEIEIEAPGADIVGFEHAAKTPAQKKAIEAAEAKLKGGDRLFAFPAGAECRMTEVEVESPRLESDKDHKHSHKHDHEDEHSEFHAHYHFQCENPGQLSHMDVRYFEMFPAAHELTVQMISASGQGVQRLTPKAARLKF